MATFNPDDNKANYHINGYNNEMVQINGEQYHTSLIVGNNDLIENWPVASTDDITEQSLACLLQLKPKIVLIGTGLTHVLLPMERYASILQQGIGVEIMSTPAACRTFNALTSEDREVAAALII